METPGQGSPAPAQPALRRALHGDPGVAPGHGAGGKQPPHASLSAPLPSPPANPKRWRRERLRVVAKRGCRARTWLTRTSA